MLNGNRFDKGMGNMCGATVKSFKNSSKFYRLLSKNILLRRNEKKKKKGKIFENSLAIASILLHARVSLLAVPDFENGWIQNVDRSIVP